ncbi:MAG: hypothetical protein JNK63_08830 [Chthonomonas sp.]|nr:hypothetical protein [Chthonomonas sp.]
MRAHLLLSAFLLAGIVSAQIPGLGGNQPKIPGVGDLFKKGPSITTSLEDAKWEAKDRDTFNPEIKDLFSLDLTPEGSFVLRAGGWAGVVQSYCLKAGTHGPGGGDGYLFAPVKGPFEGAVSAVGRNSVAHPEIPQRTIQLLLWAMIARTKFMDLPRELQAAAAKLLTTKQISDINGGALALLTDERLGGAIVKEPPLVRQALEAENRLRGMLTNPASTFEQMEAVAVLTGAVERGKGSRDVPFSRWSLHPDGYYVRYQPSGYSTTRLEVYVPENSKAIGKKFDPASQIAVPGNTARQRLLQTARKQKA